MDTLETIDPEHVRIATELEQQGVRFATGSFMDITGRAKSKIVPIDHLPNLLAGSECYTPRGMGDLGVMTPNEDECVTMPDLATLRVMPWDRRFAWMAADLLFGGREPFAHCTRSVLKRQVAAAADMGLMMNLGVEPEFYVFDPASLDRTDGYLEPLARSGKLRPTQAYDVESELDAMDFLKPMSRYLTETGFGLFSFDSEGGSRSSCSACSATRRLIRCA